MTQFRNTSTSSRGELDSPISQYAYLLSVTAPEFFAPYGFKRDPRDHAPDALKASKEFQGACPDSAAFMSLTLVETQAKNT